jgi:hypothetical protein
MDSLSDKEKKYLDHYSMNNEFLDDEELTTTKHGIRGDSAYLAGHLLGL